MSDHEPGGSSTTASNAWNEQSIPMYAVVPLRECPHLSEVRGLPPEGVNAQARCADCGTNDEAWVCLTCYNVNCGRYIAGHAIAHQNRYGHPMALSLSDISVWCYTCEAYIHNEVLVPAKRAVHRSKFGIDLPENCQ